MDDEDPYAYRRKGDVRLTVLSMMRKTLATTPKRSDCATATPTKIKPQTVLPKRTTSIPPLNHSFYARQPYRPLDKFNRSIRILQVSRDSITGERLYTLTEERPLFEARDKYTAISYCAGEPKDTRELLVDGSKFNAFASLARAIDETCHYRETAYQDTTPLLWTDEICINQNDSEERSHQVSMMYHVYENARDVAICLSASDDTYNVGACGWIGRMTEDFPEELLDPIEGDALWGTCFSVTTDELKEASSSVKKAHATMEKIKRQIQTNTRDRFFLTGLLSALTALTAPWWTRAWVAQGFVASRTAVFIIGRQYLPSALFLATAVALAELRDQEMLFPENKLGRLVEGRWVRFQDSYDMSSTLNLLDDIAIGVEMNSVLRSCAYRKASDKRDMV